MTKIILRVWYFIIMMVPAAFFSLNAGAQDSGHIIFHLSPRDVIIRLDTTRIVNGTSTKVSIGKHVIRAWAPYRELFTDTVTVTRDSNIIMLKKLDYSSQYKEYIKKKSTFKASVIVTGAMAVSAIGGYLLNRTILKSNLEKAKEFQELYSKSISLFDIESYKSGFENYSHKYDRSRTINNAIVIGGPLVCLTGLFVSMRLAKEKHKVKPEIIPMLSFKTRGNPSETNIVGSISTTIKF